MLITVSTLLLIFIALTVTIAVEKHVFRQKVKREAESLFAANAAAQPAIVTESELLNLPEPVQRWLRYARVIGKERILRVRMRQRGTFRRKRDQPWMPFKAEEYFTTTEPSLLWYASMRAAPLLSIEGRDLYRHGKGNMLIKLLSLITVADARGPKLDQGALLRYLSEMLWFPTAALRDYIAWEPIDDTSARATMNYGDVSAAAVFYFNTEGQVTRITAERYREERGTFSLDTWETPIHEYGDFHGIRVPRKAEALWKLNDGEFPYVRLELTAIDFNPAEIYP